MPSNHLVLCHSLLFLLSIFPTIRVFSNESALPIRGPKYWSFSFSISPSKEYSALISFSIDCFDLLAVQGTLESLLQHHSSKASILQCSAFFMLQLSHPYMTIWKTNSPARAVNIRLSSLSPITTRKTSDIKNCQEIFKTRKEGALRKKFKKQVYLQHWSRQKSMANFLN